MAESASRCWCLTGAHYGRAQRRRPRPSGEAQRQDPGRRVAATAGPDGRSSAPPGVTGGNAVSDGPSMPYFPLTGAALAQYRSAGASESRVFSCATQTLTMEASSTVANEADTSPVASNGSVAAAPAQSAPRTDAREQRHTSGVRSVALSLVVEDAVNRWFEETYREATRGDVKMQALAGQMFAEGYGCQQDQKLAKQFSDKARRRGYHMQGVYCEL